jgi:hypothetical protein
MTPRWIRPLFIVAALYDLGLGAAYLFLYPSLYARFGVALPNHPGYVQLNALFVMIMGVGFWMVANAPARNRDLILLGMLFKAAYAGVVFLYWARGMMPSMWLIWAVCDTLFLITFAVAQRSLTRAEPARG